LATHDGAAAKEGRGGSSAAGQEEKVATPDAELRERVNRTRREIAPEIQQTLEPPTLGLMRAAAEGASPAELVHLTRDWVRAVADCFAFGISQTIHEGEKLEKAEHHGRQGFWETVRETHLDPMKDGINELLVVRRAGEAKYSIPTAVVAEHLVQEPSSRPSWSAVTVPISSLDPEPAELLRDIAVVVQPRGEGYVATYFDASISMSGDTQEEAVQNLKAVMVHVLEELESEPAETLGPALARQLAALRRVMRRTAEASVTR
jgi:hypothetical protein